MRLRPRHLYPGPSLIAIIGSNDACQLVWCSDNLLTLTCLGTWMIYINSPPCNTQQPTKGDIKNNFLPGRRLQTKYQTKYQIGHRGWWPSSEQVSSNPYVCFSHASVIFSPNQVVPVRRAKLASAETPQRLPDVRSRKVQPNIDVQLVPAKDHHVAGPREFLAENPWGHNEEFKDTGPFLRVAVFAPASAR